MADNINKITQIQDSILEAMKVYYQEQAKNLKHDVTVDATIVDISEKANGAYTVTSDGARFKAYALSGSYYTNESVLVSIPNGDYNNQKFILGRKTDEETANTVFSFKLPFDDFIGLQFINEGKEYDNWYWANKHYFKDAIDENGEILKDENGENIKTSEEDIEEYLIERFNIENSLMGCTKLGIEADFTTYLGKFHPSNGIYGFRIVVSGVSKTTDVTESIYTTEEYYFTNNDMYGNTYAYQVPYTQQKILDVSKFLNIQEIQIYFFQDHSFIDDTGNLIPYEGIPANIGITNLHIWLGLTSDEINAEKTFLYTFDSLNYESIEDKRILHFAWVHKEAENKFSIIKDIEDLNAQKRDLDDAEPTVHWYRFRYKTERIDKYGGVNWEYLPEYDNNFSLKLGGEERLKLDPSLSREKYKVVVIHNGIHTTSDILTFQNSNDVESFTANDEIILKCLRPQKDNVLVEDPISAFYVYDENNRVLKNDGGEVFSNIVYYLQVQVRNNNESTYVPLQIEDDSDITIAWAFPQSFTMFHSFEKITTEDPGFTGFDSESSDFKNLQKVTVKFKIKNILDVRYIDNTIKAIITRNKVPTYISKTFQFGRAGSFGNEITPVLRLVDSEDHPISYIKTGNSFKVECKLIKRDGRPVEAPGALYSWRVIGGNNISDENGGSWHPGNVFRTAKCVLNGTNPVPPVFEVTVIGAADYPVTIRKGFLASNDSEYMDTHVILVPDRVEFKSDGASPIYYSNNFEVQRISTDNSKNQMEYPIWHINSETQLFTLKESLHKEDTFTCQNGDTIVRPEFREYALRPKVQNSTLQWSESMIDDSHFTYIYYELFIYGKGKIYVAQSIAFDRNKYPSSLINSWNGTDLTLDIENNAVMARMIAAGTKDTNNRFTGVAMGDWSDKADESLDETGIYGFNNGEQTFAFKKDGTGFIGSAGKGRIEFDGTEALISNHDKTCYINLNPVNLKENLLLIENRSFSQYFLYAQVEKNKNIIQSTIPENTLYWTKKYFDDDENDYFIVDPNNGIITSGGIIAKYGNIGNWKISSQGLYQKVSANEETPGKYMFLGYNPSKASDDAEDTTTYCIFAGDNELSNPIFSVTWDGILTARKGIIGKSSPWKISDDGLTQENIFGRIFLGNPAKNNHNPWWFDNTTRIDLAQNNNVGFAISAGDKTSDLINTPSEMAMKFGVRLDGFLYSTMGLIGGWNITNNELISANEGIRMNSEANYIVVGKGDTEGTLEKYSIILDGQRGIIQIKNQGTGTAAGQIQLAGYIFQALSQGTFTYPYALNSTKSEYEDRPGTTFSTDIKYDNTNGWDDVNSSGVISSSKNFVNPPIGCLINDNGDGINNTTLSSTNLLGFIGRHKTNSNIEENFGVGIATGYTNNNKKAVVIYPTGTDENQSSLGVSGALWNIYANIINCAGINTTGYLSAETIYMNNALVATQDYVYNMLVDVWNAIGSASNGVGSNAKSIQSLGNTLKGEVVTGIRTEVKEGMTRFYIKKKDGTEIEGLYSANAVHKHPCNLSISNGVLKAENGAVAETEGKTVSLNHSHTVVASFNEGKISVEVKDANFSNPSSGGASLIDITTTTWYKSKVYAYTSFNDPNPPQYSNKWYTVSYKIFTQDNESRSGGTFNIDATAAYNAGWAAAYNAGWAAAAAEFKRDGDTVWGPSTEVNTKRKYTASVSSYTRSYRTNVPQVGYYTNENGIGVRFNRSGDYYITNPAKISWNE